MKRIKLLLIFGGQSSEHEISLMSAANIFSAVDKNRYTVSLIKITRDGVWKLVSEISDNDQGAEATLDISAQSFNLADGTRIIPEIVFPILHGKYGEDGTIQGLLDLMHLSYVGCGVEASALCMDKVRTKRLLSRAGVDVVPSISLRSSEGLSHDNVLSELGEAPWFVKPSRAGSSVGVTKVHSVDELLGAIETAFEHDSEVLIEKAIVGHEIEVSILGNYQDIIVSTPGEIIPGEEFYSYDDKYADSSKSEVSFDLPPGIISSSDAIRQIAETSYRVLGCRGLSRVDFFVTDDNKIYVNEINTMPGFTNISMYPKLMEKIGYDTPALVDKLISLALE